jgi:hypothetical protein
MTDLPDLFDGEGPPDLRRMDKQQALSSIYYQLVASGQNRLQFRESSQFSREAERTHHFAPDTVDWSKQKRVHLYGKDPVSGQTYCVTCTPGKGASVFVPPSYEMTVYWSECLSKEGTPKYHVKFGRAVRATGIVRMLDVPRALRRALTQYVTTAARNVHTTGMFHPVASRTSVNWSDWIHDNLKENTYE